MPIEILIILVAIIIVAILLRRPKVFRGGLQDALMPKRTREELSQISLSKSFIPPHSTNTDLLENTICTVDVQNIRPPDIPFEYQSTDSMLKMSLHLGQLKLFLSEMQFLTEVLPSRDTPAFCIYAGSSPSHKGFALSGMFSGVKFIFVDPHEHFLMDEGGNQYSDDHIDRIMYLKVADGNRYNIRGRIVNFLGKRTPRGEAVELPMPEDIVELIRKSPQKIFIIEDLMTSELAKKMAPLGAYFMSDIRTASAGYNPSDVDILFNCAMTYCWIYHLNPQSYVLKFRPPYRSAEVSVPDYMNEAFAECKSLGLDLLENHKNGVFKFLEPKALWIQAYAREWSGESRLYGKGLKLVSYDIKKYEDRFFYYNRVIRIFGYHTSHEKYLDRDLGIDRCGDCSLMCFIVERYYRKYGLNESEVVPFIKRLLSSIERTLKPPKHFHGHYFESYGTNQRYVIGGQMARLFMYENKPPSLYTSRKTLDDWYRRKLAIDLIKTNYDAGWQSDYKFRVHMLDFLDPHEPYFEKMLKFMMNDYDVVDEMLSILRSRVKYEGPPIELEDYILKVRLLGRNIDQFGGPRWESFLSAIIKFANVNPKETVLISVIREELDSFSFKRYLITNPPDINLVNFDCPLAIYSLCYYQTFSKACIIEQLLARKQKTILIMHRNTSTPLYRYFNLRGVSAFPARIVANFDISQFMADENY